MDVHKDGFIAKLCFILLGIGYIPVLAIAYTHGGIGSVLFATWIFFAFIVFLLIAIWQIDKATNIRPDHGFTRSYISVWANAWTYKVLLVMVGIVLLFATYYLHEFLEEKFPLKRVEAPVSSMPTPLR